MTPGARASGDAPRGSIVGTGTRMTGRLHVAGSLHFSGELVGEVRVEGELRLTADARVEGAVSARSVFVGGRVRGPVSAAAGLEVGRGGAVEGDISAACIVLGEGSEHDGRIDLLVPASS